MKNEYLVTWPLYRAWAMEGAFRGARLILMIVWLLLGLISLLLFLSGSSIFYLLITLYSLYRAFLRHFVLANNIYRTLAKTYGKDSWLRTISFEEACIRVTEETSSVYYLYADISDIREKGDQITLVFKNTTLLRLYRSAFVGTEWAACKAWIQSHRSA